MSENASESTAPASAQAPAPTPALAPAPVPAPSISATNSNETQAQADPSATAIPSALLNSNSANAAPLPPFAAPMVPGGIGAIPINTVGGSMPMSLPATGFPAMATGATVAAPVAGQGMTANEIALYDRQIRLWGKQAQEKIRTASVLLIGLKGLGNEVAKNLVLAGIGSLTIVEDQNVSEEDLGAQFLVREEDIGKNRGLAAQPRLQEMNPRVKLFVNTASVIELALMPTFFQAFSVVIATDLTIDLLQPLNAACRLVPTPFYAATTHGLYGYIFADLGLHTFIIEREKSNIPTKPGPETPTRTVIASSTKKSDDGKTIEAVTKTEQYSPLAQVVNAPLPADRVSTRRRKLQVSPLLACIRALWRFQLSTARPYPEETREDLAMYTTIATNEHKTVLNLPHETMRSEVLRAFLQGVSAEISPTCSLIGAQLSQDVINVVGQIEQPLQNLLVWDGDELTGEVYAMHAPPQDTVPVVNPAVGVGAMPLSAPLPIQSVSLQQQQQQQQPVMNVNGNANGVNVGNSAPPPAPAPAPAAGGGGQTLQ